MTTARVAWSFLTRLPGGRHPDDAAALAAAVPWFPAVGVVIGAACGLLWLGATELVSAPSAALVAVAGGALITGAFHEDGLADTADAMGGYDPARRLEIMRDSRVGTFGALALVIGTGLKVAPLAAMSGPDGVGALIAAHGLGRAAALLPMAVGPDARTDGLAADTSTLPRRAVGTALTITMAAALAVGPALAVAAAAASAAALVMVVVARRRFGGITGDVLGATEQLGEIIVLTTVAAIVADHGWLW